MLRGSSVDTDIRKRLTTVKMPYLLAHGIKSASQGVFMYVCAFIVLRHCSNDVLNADQVLTVIDVPFHRALAMLSIIECLHLQMIPQVARQQLGQTTRAAPCGR